jgi:hypothetical protein
VLTYGGLGIKGLWCVHKLKVQASPHGSLLKDSWRFGFGAYGIELLCWSLQIVKGYIVQYSLVIVMTHNEAQVGQEVYFSHLLSSIWFLFYFQRLQVCPIIHLQSLFKFLCFLFHFYKLQISTWDLAALPSLLFWLCLIVMFVFSSCLVLFLSLWHRLSQLWIQIWT